MKKKSHDIVDVREIHIHLHPAALKSSQPPTSDVSKYALTFSISPSRDRNDLTPLVTRSL